MNHNNEVIVDNCRVCGNPTAQNDDGTCVCFFCAKTERRNKMTITNEIREARRYRATLESQADEVVSEMTLEELEKFLQTGGK